MNSLRSIAFICLNILIIEMSINTTSIKWNCNFLKVFNIELEYVFTNVKIIFKDVFLLFIFQLKY